MTINFTSNIKAVSFGDKILNENNKNSVSKLREKFDDLKENGIPIGDCFYTVPEERNINLTTNDKKYKAGLSCWGHNLIISEKLPSSDTKKAVIAPDGDVFYTDSVDDFDIKNVESDSPLSVKVNEFLTKALNKFL